LSCTAYHGSADILRGQMAPLAPSLRNVELVHLDAPSLAAGDFGWWHNPSRGWDRTRTWATELFATQPRFDGCSGSVRAPRFAGLLAGMREEPDEHTIDFDFAVMVGGFKNDAPAHAPLYQHQFTLPSVHIIGRTDGVIPPRESEALAAQFENRWCSSIRAGTSSRGCAVVGGLTAFLERMSRQVARLTGGDAVRGRQ